VKVDAYAGDNSVYPTGTDSITYGTGAWTTPRTPR